MVREHGLLVYRTGNPLPVSVVDELTPEQWVEELHSHSGDDLPLLPDEAISREPIYEDRGL
jgi:hypothetical protein